MIRTFSAPILQITTSIDITQTLVLSIIYQTMTYTNRNNEEYNGIILSPIHRFNDNLYIEILDIGQPVYH